MANWDSLLGSNNRMRTYKLIFFMIICQYGRAQTTICDPDTTNTKKICLDNSAGKKQNVVHQELSYSYQELDSIGNYLVLGNLDINDHPIGNWCFFIRDLTINGNDHWFRGQIKDGYLEGKWSYSNFCVRFYSKGVDANPNPCPSF
ncbi:MAG: hypothetical protein ACJAUD_002499 [Crocinitomicaceae bacterium]|jgi:hypothetical protein